MNRAAQVSRCQVLRFREIQTHVTYGYGPAYYVRQAVDATSDGVLLHYWLLLGAIHNFSVSSVTVAIDTSLYRHAHAFGMWNLSGLVVRSGAVPL